MNNIFSAMLLTFGGLCFFLIPRRCGYSKAKQDPEEEKMHFHNGHSKFVKPDVILLFCAFFMCKILILPKLCPMIDICSVYETSIKMNM